LRKKPLWLCGALNTYPEDAIAGEQNKAYCPAVSNGTILNSRSCRSAVVLSRVAEADVWDQPCLPQSAFPAPLRVFRQAGRDSSVTLHGSLQIERPPLKKEKSMETTKSDTSITNDVLHLGSESKLSAEAIAKAVAHHNRHHSGDQPQQAAAKAGAGKKGKSGK
jgi:hypothetical protein